jgi:2-polyprenyl-3-methyl-5-hydroxy-6-metoxy-1,4-benzoquinol methylase
MTSQSTKATVPPTVQLETVVCPLGCPSHDETVIAGHDLLHGLPGKFTVVRCSACGLQRTSPRPTPETIGLYYPDDYGPYKGTRVVDGGGNVRGLKARLLELAKRIFDTKASAIPQLPLGRMLEIGCASGSYLHHMAQRGWEVEGIEYSPTAAQSARALGYVVDIGALETITKPAERYDLIVGWMVLEHLHQPVESLRKLAGWARKDAMLVVSVPNVGSAESRIFGSNWYALQLPTHLFHYDTSSIAKVMQAGGWQVTRIHHHRTAANLIASMGYWLRDHGFTRIAQQFISFPERGGRLGALLMFPLALPLACFGQTGRMTVWAKKVK